MSVNTVTTTNQLNTPETSDGFQIGSSSTTSKLGFYGTAPITQPTAAAQTAVVDTSGGTANAATGITTITGTYNSTILANAVATIVVELNGLRTALVNLGLIKGS